MKTSLHYTRGKVPSWVPCSTFAVLAWLSLSAAACTSNTKDERESGVGDGGTDGGGDDGGGGGGGRDGGGFVGDGGLVADGGLTDDTGYCVSDLRGRLCSEEEWLQYRCDVCDDIYYCVHETGDNYRWQITSYPCECLTKDGNIKDECSDPHYNGGFSPR